jgi:hypothetical protein
MSLSCLLEPYLKCGKSFIVNGRKRSLRDVVAELEAQGHVMANVGCHSATAAFGDNQPVATWGLRRQA